MDTTEDGFWIAFDKIPRYRAIQDTSTTDEFSSQEDLPLGSRYKYQSYSDSEENIFDFEQSASLLHDISGDSGEFGTFQKISPTTFTSQSDMEEKTPTEISVVSQNDSPVENEFRCSSDSNEIENKSTDSEPIQQYNDEEDDGTVTTAVNDILPISTDNIPGLRKRNVPSSSTGLNSSATIHTVDGQTPVTKLLSKVKVGRSIWIQGRIEDTPLSFSVNLQSNSDSMPDADILFMFAFNFTDDSNGKVASIMCNSYLYGSWGLAETYHASNMEGKTFPFKAGESFELKISLNRAGYDVYSKDRKLVSFTHRSSVDRLRYIRIDGDISLTNFQCPRIAVLPHIVIPQYGVRPGQVLVLDAFIKPDAESLQLQMTSRHQNVYTGFFVKVTFDGEITAIHCQGFKNDKMEERVVIDGHLPIIPDMELEIRITIQPKHFQIFMDGDWYAEYDHELPLDKLSQITLVGDMHVYACELTEPRAKFGRLGRRSRCFCHIL